MVDCFNSRRLLCSNGDVTNGDKLNSGSKGSSVDDGDDGDWRLDYLNHELVATPEDGLVILAALQ